MRGSIVYLRGGVLRIILFYRQTRENDTAFPMAIRLIYSTDKGSANMTLSLVNVIWLECSRSLYIMHLHWQHHTGQSGRSVEQEVEMLELNSLSKYFICELTSSLSNPSWSPVKKYVTAHPDIVYVYKTHAEFCMKYFRIYVVIPNMRTIKQDIV